MLTRREFLQSGLAGLVLGLPLVSEAAKKELPKEKPKLQDSLDIYDLNGRNVGGLTNNLSKQFSAGKKRLALISFGASWCIPCMFQLSAFNWFFDNYSAHGLYICGINIFERGNLKEEIAATKREITIATRKRREGDADYIIKEDARYPHFLMEKQDVEKVYESVFGRQKEIDFPLNLLVDDRMQIVYNINAVSYYVGEGHVKMLRLYDKIRELL